MPVSVCIACGVKHPDETSSSLQICTRCGTSETSPRPDPATLEAQYSEAYYGPDNVKFIPPVESFVAWMSRQRARRIHGLIASPGRILEIGCGRGLLLSQLAELGHDCHGIERSPLAARRAAQTRGIHVYTQPPEECHFPEQHFDAVILWHVLEHLDHPRATLSLISRLLKPGGLLHLEVPNFSSLQSCSTGRNWFHLDLEHHLYHFSADGLRRLLMSTGFRIEKMTTLSLEQGPYGVLQSWLNAIEGEQGKLYRILKREISLGVGAKLREFVLAGTLSVPAALFALMEASIGRGGVLRVVSRAEASRSSFRRCNFGD